MKKITFALIVISWGLFYDHSKAQPYETVFGVDTTQWNVFYLIPDYDPTYIYKAYGDTSINYLNYKILYEGGGLGKTQGYLREDTLTGKLWFLSKSGTETLIMDLALEKTDTFIFSTFGPNMEFSVDTVFYRSGRKYISFNGSSPDSIFFIEGIGPSNFLYSEWVNFPFYAQLRCMFKDNILIFHNSRFTNCYDSGTGVISNQLQSFNIYPNPASEIITFPFDNGINLPIEIYNSVGYLIFKEDYINNRQINISEFPPGLYIVRINIGSNIFIQKFIKI
jgi:hypothetical protein